MVDYNKFYSAHDNRDHEFHGFQLREMQAKINGSLFGTFKRCLSKDIDIYPLGSRLALLTLHYDYEIETIELSRQRQTDWTTSICFPSSLSRPDPIKRCKFYDDVEHNPEECVTLRMEVAYLLGNDYLTKIVAMNKSSPSDGTSGGS
ncbi:unnamed protein product [Cuscuta epithymum]|uniref:DNA-directed RNA polymerase n=1 Tax=Cuscuta epithymum TaxID=186058 RepID=A0AAV0DI70_9ASTE|nr:unnamed protein product [Cuscuta epithymum]